MCAVCGEAFPKLSVPAASLQLLLNECFFFRLLHMTYMTCLVSHGMLCVVWHGMAWPGLTGIAGCVGADWPLLE